MAPEQPVRHGPGSTGTIGYEEIMKRNSVERIKAEKLPFDVVDDLEELARKSYEDIDEDDILRLQWYGLYHDKPKVGRFMLRVKIAGGILTPAQLRRIGELSLRYGENSGEITTRQDIQLHHIRHTDLAAILDEMEEAGLTSQGACGDILRNITSCPVAGLDPGEVFDPRPVVREVAAFFYGNRLYSDLPRKYKFTIASCPHWCNAPEIHDVALVGVLHQGQKGFAVLVGGGLSTFPRLADPLGVFVAEEDALAVLRAITDVWREDYRYRRSRVKARLKFMVEEDGAAELRRRVEERLGHRLPDLPDLPRPSTRTDHLGVHPQKQEGLYYIGFPVFPGRISGEQMVALAEVASSCGGDVRLTREQNFILTGVPEDRVSEVVDRVRAIGFPLDVNPVRGHSIGCTGQPYCNYAVGETKTRLQRLVEHLEERFGDRVADLRLYLDGCPHACGQHFVGDIGFQGTTLALPDGRRVQAFDVFLRGGLGADAAIGRPVLRRVPDDRLDDAVSRLVAAYLAERKDGEGFAAFCRRLDDETLTRIALGAEAAARCPGGPDDGQGTARGSNATGGNGEGRGERGRHRGRPIGGALRRRGPGRGPGLGLRPLRSTAPRAGQQFPDRRHGAPGHGPPVEPLGAGGHRRHGPAAPGDLRPDGDGAGTLRRHGGGPGARTVDGGGHGAPPRPQSLLS
ncbi:MAG: nitrite/sulfite reductase [Clostridia bacterium]|nr:nitrite/sulfite reductase [Clostridia bacterium]